MKAAIALLLSVAGVAPAGAAPWYGLIGKMTAVPGKRDALVTALVAGTRAMPGCVSYVVGKDAADPDAIWISEVWVSKASHDASLALPAVRRAIMVARPLIAGMSDSHETVPVSIDGRAPK